ncbi:reverse transcriptase, partial [Phytophthora megakarya]
MVADYSGEHILREGEGASGSVMKMLRDAAPPAVMVPKYKWPTKLLVRAREPDRAQVTKIVEERVTKKVESAEDVTLGAYSPSVIVSLMVVEVSPELVTLDVNTQDDGEVANSGSCGDVPDEMAQRSECDAFQDDPSTEGEDFELPTSTVPETPLARLDAAYARCMRVSAEQLDLEPAVYIREGSELMSQLKDQLVMLPDLDDFSPECDIKAADVGERGESTEAQAKQLKAILKRHQKICLGDGNAAPPPARGVICDLDVGDARPVAQRPRSVGPHLAIKVYKLLKKFLEATLIEHSESPWASPIGIVLKKNGVAIRMCIDYRVVNSFIQLSNYPLPLIDDLITGFEGMMWFLSLDMASGFWAVRMTERAKLISAFTCPFGHFQWVRMPFGLKNAPLIYQQMITCLRGFVRLSPEEEALVDQDVLDYLKMDPQSSSEEIDAGRSMTPLLEQMTVFRRNIPAPSQMEPVLGRSSYIDEIAHGAATWDQLCGDLDALLYQLQYWSISVSLLKSEFGKRGIPYLSREIGAEGIRATPKIVKGIQELPFPATHPERSSLNYYHKFIEDYAVVAASLYELTDDQ